MKIVIIKGSPHKKGSSNMLTEQFIKGAQEAGHTVIEMDAAHMDIRPCLGCEHCGMNGPCIQKDDMAQVRDALLSADMAVFVTPVYYFGMSAQLKMVIDRFYSYTMKLAQAAGADLYEIKPAVPYTKDDLNWMDKRYRSSVEMNDKSSRPELADKDADIAVYDTVLLGFPIWWYVAPAIVKSFLESYDFSGKKIVLFATSGGSGFGNTAAGLKASVAADTAIVEGKILNEANSVNSLQKWVETIL